LETAETSFFATERPSGVLDAKARLEEVVRKNYSMAWRLARRWGLTEADADDVVQQAVVVVSRRLGEITPGSERAFLCRATLFLANKARRRLQGTHEMPGLELDEIRSREPDPEEVLERRRACHELDAILDELPEPLRAAFVLFELELQTQVDVAEALQIPQGTVASRVRRAREIVNAAIERRARKNQKIGSGR
jgi:RNA polymerase sigma-70 factor (ECF subfamily)